MSYQDCCEYFGRKLDYWNTCKEGCNLNQYITLQGEEGILNELRNDSLFLKVVCPFLRFYTREEQGNVVLSIISQAYSVAHGNLTQPILQIIIGAALRLCGYEEEGRKKIEEVLLAIIFGGALWLASTPLRSRSKARKRKKTRGKQ